MFNNKLNVNIDGGLDYHFPKMALVRQDIKRSRLENVESTLSKEFNRVIDYDLKGRRIAIGVGSRGIARQIDVLSSTIKILKEKGATPFIVPSMGSHGGATAEGQTSVLESYGITPERIGVPIFSSMETVQVATLEDGTPLYCDKYAFEADRIVLCNKIKPHADFKAAYESGLVKMIVIGLSNHKGATAIHHHGFENFHTVLPATAKTLLQKLPILFGIAIMENAYDEIMDVDLVPGHQIMEREKHLLEVAKANIPRILIPNIDVLIIDEIGKNISGEGMDPNVTGRPGSKLPGFNAPEIKRIVVLDVTRQSHGNGVGIGMADLTTTRLVKKLDLGAIYTNAITAGILDPAKIPLAMNHDQEAIAVAIRICPLTDTNSARIVRIKNTLELERVQVPEPLIDLVETSPHLEIITSPQPMEFDETGRLSSGW